MRIQRILASDVAMSFDECTPYPATEAQARASMELSMRWAVRGFREYYGAEPPGTLFGIVQGGVHPHLRLRIAGGPRGDRLCRTRRRRPRGRRERGGARPRARCSCCRRCRALKPRYLMGVGRPEDIVEAVRRGIDMFDCVMPTRHARNAHLFTRAGVDQHPQCGPPQGHRADRGGMRLLYLPELQPQLSAAFGQVRRNTGRAPEHRP